MQIIFSTKKIFFKLLEFIKKLKENSLKSLLQIFQLIQTTYDKN